VITAAGDGFNAAVTAETDDTVINAKDFEQLKFNSASELNVTVQGGVKHLDLYTADTSAGNTSTEITTESNVGKLSVTTGDNADIITIKDHEGSFDKELDLHTWSGDDDITVSGNHVTGILYTGDQNDTIDLTGITSGEITVNAGSGNDTMIAGGAAEKFVGGDGIDTVSYAASSAPVEVDLSDGQKEKGGAAEGDTLSSIEAVIGSDGNDILIGNSKAGNNQFLEGGDGSDIITGGAGNDLLVGGSTTDAVKGDLENILGNLDGSNSDVKALRRYVDQNQKAEGDTIKAGSGNDVVIDLAGDNYIEGGHGADTIITGSGNDVVLGGTSVGLTADNIATARAEMNSATDANAVKVAGDKFKHTFSKDNAADGGDTIYSGDGHDLVFGGNGDDEIHAGLGNDYVKGGAGNDHIFGDDGHDVLYGGKASDTLEGGLGDDLFIGGDGADHFYGGTKEGDSGTDTVSYEGKNAVTVNLSDSSQSTGVAKGDTFNGIEKIIGSSKNDTLEIGEDKPFTVTISKLANGVEHFVVTDGSGKTVIEASDFENIRFTEATNVTVVGTTEASGVNVFTAENKQVHVSVEAHEHSKLTITTGNEDDVIDLSGPSSVSSAQVTINAGTGDDTMLAGSATETFNGGLNDEVGDTVSYAASDSAVRVDLLDVKDNETNAVKADGIADKKGSGGEAEGDTYTGIENLIGSKHADTLKGDSEANDISGGLGSDTIEGRGGDDVLHGGNEPTVAAGDSDPLELITDGSFDILSEGARPNTWTHVRPSEESHWKAMNGDAKQNGKAEVVNDHNNNFVEIDVAGKTDALSQTIVTNDKTEYVLTFRAVTRETSSNVESNELLIVRIGDEEYVLTPKAGSTHGGWQNYSLRFKGAEGEEATTITFTEDVVQGRSENGIFLDDVSVRAVDDTISGGAGNDTIYGEGGHDILNGGLDSDIVIGGDGDDFLVGGAGADHLIGGNATVVGHNASPVVGGDSGIDTVSYEDSHAGVTVNLTDKDNNGTADANGSGGDAEGDTLSGIENLIGSDQADTLTGDTNANTIDGGAGADTIKGGIGNDVLYGGDNDISTRELIDDDSFGGLSDNADAPSDIHWDPSTWGNCGGVVGDGNWTVDNGIEVHHNGPNSYVEVDNYGYGEFISQTIETDAGGTYTLNFDAWNNEYSNWVERWTGQDGIKVDIIDSHGTVIRTEVFSGDDINSSTGRTESFSFEAKDGQTTVKFYQDGDVDDACPLDICDQENGINLDNVSVVKASGDYLYGGDGQDTLNGGAGDLDVLNGGGDEDIFLFTSDDFKESGQTTFIQDFKSDEDSLQFSDVISGDGEETYTVSEFSQSGGDTTFTVTATQDGSTEALTHTIVLQDDISMDQVYLQQLINSGS
ncbi:calcium-binding protein, partial [Halodesulfovibrio marinisediminis]